ncbi:MAG: hypothetical protein SFX73_11360 [Kofleriaceae bacterium]|nr:hypothetical protein [Kofleriaceae bacterium]
MSLRTFLLGVVLVSSACGKKSEEAKPSPAPAPSTKEPAEPPTEKAPPIAPATGMFTCKNKDAAPASAAKPDAAKNPWALPFTPGPCPAVPSAFGEAAFDMELAAAAKAMKGSKIDGTSIYLYVGKRPFAQQFVARANEATGKIDEFSFKIDEEGFAAFKAAWGEPTEYTNLSDKILAWYDPATKIKITARADEWNRADPKTKEDVDVPGYRVNVTRYTPLADLLAAEGLIAKPLIGKTVQEIAAAYPAWMEVKTADQAKADLDNLGLDEATKAKANALGASDASANMKLPEAETNSHHLLVQPDWEGGKMTKYSFSLPYGKDEKLKAELLGVVAGALGQPTASEKKDKGWKYTFKGQGATVVTLEPGSLDDDWRLEVSAAR